jgi:uncharacterized ferritin-like protein (DUF455 family)
MARFKRVGEQRCQEILLNNFHEELTHVQAGVKWFTFICQKYDLDPTTVFHDRFPNYFKGRLKDTNFEARKAAGFPLEWFAPFVQS